ncbi:hypothetical protein GCM10027091_32950 [Streptomyces daliensis]
MDDLAAHVAGRTGHKDLVHAGSSAGRAPIFPPTDGTLDEVDGSTPPSAQRTGGRGGNYGDRPGTRAALRTRGPLSSPGP